jgi:RHS repeat-associated protein
VSYGRRRRRSAMRFGRTAATVGVILALVAGPVPAVVTAESLDRSSAAVNAREPLLRPADLGDGTVDGLQYADPTEGLALVAPPEQSPSARGARARARAGSAQLAYPFVIPPGRGITPDLQLSYDSAGGSSWVGLGWDLSVGDISVDARFGAPHFDQAKESETYLLDGDVLVPNATDGPWEDRVEGDRQDYTRQVETEYEQIIRHDADDGDARTTDDYYWEVRDKKGNIRWYGGFPDAGGPYGFLQQTAGGTIDPTAIVYDDEGNAVRWLLSAERDVGVNVMRYLYETIEYARTTTGWTPQDCDPAGTVMCGRHTYLDRITYTEAAEVAPDPSDPDPTNRGGDAFEGDAPYEVHFLRESETNPAGSVRSDPIVDASGRFVDVVVDRLARIEVRHGDPEPNGAARTYDEVATRYDLGYTTGPFGKSLLTTVTQVGTAPGDSAVHTFNYNDEVLADDGSYDGFAGPTTWNTGADLDDRTLLDPVSIGALGSSESNSGEGHAYIGFNALIPDKNGSFGGSLQIGAGGTEAIAEWIDLNGDTLPDKVFEKDGGIHFRLNTSGPDGATDFTGSDEVAGDLPRLSREVNIDFQLSVEAHVVVTAIFGLGGQVSIGDSYFTDVNADGFPDFVSGGTVYFNRLDADGVPTFQTGSTGTVVPLPVDGGAPTVEVDQLDEIQADLTALSPPVDTVRRWTAPTSGTVSISAPVSLVADSPDDGVRVAIQHNGNELQATNLLTSASTAFQSAFTRNVVKGDHLYFRVGSVADGREDEVNWSPTITYTAITGVADLSTLGPDVNGLSQTVYSPALDFTLAGRPNSVAVMPYKGTVEVTAEITKSDVTSDNLRLVVLHNGAEVSVPSAVVAAGFTGDATISTSFAVDRPVFPTEANPNTVADQDTVEVYLEADSPIDLTAIDFAPRLVYTAAVDENDVPIDLAAAPVELDLLPEIEQYPNRQGDGASVAWTPPTSGTFDLAASLNRGPNSPGGQLVATIKNANGTPVAKAAAQVGPTGLPGAQPVVFDLNAALVAGTRYYADVMIRVPELSDGTALAGAALRPNGAPDATTDVAVPAELRWRGRQTIFPLAYRGWAVAGYTAAGDKATARIDPVAFELSADDFDTGDAPDGFEDIETENLGANLEPAYAFVPLREDEPLVEGQPAPLDGAHWRGPRVNHAADGEQMRTSLYGADSVEVTAPAGADGRGVTRVGLAIPSAALAIGVGPLGGSFGVGPSFGLVDFEDMNGDGYPDVVTPGTVHFTDQRGAFLADDTAVGDLAVANQDLTFSVSAGLSVDLADIKGNSKGKTNAVKNTSAAGKGGDANDSDGGVGIGGGVDFSWTSPNASGGSPGVPGTYDDALAQVPDESTGGTAPIQIALADVNGDGLPDRVFTTPQGTFAQYSLGYRFTSQSVKLTTGGFQSVESSAGNVSLGFTTPLAEFAGGVSANWNYDQAIYTWQDVNGDGILDQVNKRGGGAEPLVAFGTGSGVLPAETYGEVATVDNGGLVPTAQQVSFDRANGIGVGADFTVYIGPLCLVACYLVINPGLSFQNTVSSTQVDLEDVDGDGAADSLETTDDHELEVRLNKVGRTNLLERVTNPLGGTIAMSYERDGNTVEHPDSLWRLSRVVVDDKRPGDGADRTATNFDYDGLRFDRVHRETLGYDTITATEMDTETAPETPLRVTVTEYGNDNVFVAGLPTSVTLRAPDGTLLRRARTAWGFRDVRDVPAGFDVLAEVTAQDLTLIGDTTSVASRGRSIAPLATRVDEETFQGGAPAQATHQTFRYDGLGNIVVQTDVGEPEDPNDDLVASYDYTDCRPGPDSTLNLSASTMTDFDDLNEDGVHDPGETQFYPDGCLGPVTRPSPIYSADLCPTWVSLPGAVRVTNGKTGAAEVVYRNRDGRGSVCDNASMTRLAESIDGTSPTPLNLPEDADVPCPEPGLAVTLLTYDSWGSYNRIIYPPDENCISYAVWYRYDGDGAGKVADVTDFDLDGSQDADVTDPELDGLSQVEVFLEGTNVPDDLLDDDDLRIGLRSTAEFDPLAGRVSKRTDANGNSIDYTYDSLRRLASISSPRPQDTDPLVTFEYRPSAPGYAYAVARHLDIFNPGDTIDTYTFVDGIGRTTQTKRDARLYQGGAVAPVIGRSVSGATNFDALGRAYEQYYPTDDTQASATTYDTVVSSVAPQVTVFDLRDRPTSVTEPGSRVTSIVYGTGSLVTGGPVYGTVRETAPNQRSTTTFVDVREVVRASDDKPLALPAALRTTFDNDAMGQLLQVTDTAGNETTHAYDLLGRRTSTTTPDGGEVEYGFDPEGKLVSKTTPNLRADGTEITYAYDFGRLTVIDHPDGTPDVSYTYGTPDDGINGAGRVVRQEDGSRIVTSEYAASGAVSSQVHEMKYHNWFNAGPDKSEFQTTMTFEYDGLGRIASLVYPDGEELTYDYDAGGLATSIVGVEEGLIRVQVGVDPVTGEPIFEDQPHTWTYEYLNDRQYDEFLDPRFEEYGNAVTTEYTPDPETRWLARQQSISPNRSVVDPQHFEIQDLNYTYDSVGNPTEYRNALPPPISSEFLGTTVQHYRYDALERVVGAAGIFELTSKRHQRYVLSLTHDADGNVTSKDQYDATVKRAMPAAPSFAPPARGELVNDATTYEVNRVYDETAPHQGTSDDQGTYHYDDNGNLVGILEEPPDKWIRRLEWDATDRMTLIDDDGSDTEYAYDDTGRRTIERGPNGGETAFVNPWVTTRNRNEMFKHIWVDDQRIATQRDDGPYEETKRYFIHKDLQGSTNVVTDYLGDTFQHHEYFATGEVWIDEKSTIFRTPYQYGGGYADDARDIINFGSRWYDQDRELFYAPDPALYDDPTAVIGKPNLAWAYTFAGGNPITNVDPSGNEWFTARSRNAVLAKHEPVRQYIARNPAVAAAVVANLDTAIPKFLVRRGVTADPKTDRIQNLSDLIDGNAIVSIDLNKGTVELAFVWGPSLTVYKRKPIAGATAGSQPAAQGATTPPVAADATNAVGGPAAGPDPAAGGAVIQRPTKPLPPVPTGVAPRRVKPLPQLPPGANAPRADQ